MKSVGIDIVEIERIKNVNNNFAMHVLSKEELEVYNQLIDKRKAEYLAGRFACKEAIIKCLSQIETPNMIDITIVNDSKGRPIAKYKNYDLLISISHENNYAVAVAELQ